MTSNIPSPEKPKKVTPAGCLLGAAMSAGLGMGLYRLTAAMGYSFYAKPFTAHNPLVLRIGTAVRTLVFGLACLGTFIFAFVTIGLILLAIQLVWQGKKQETI